MNSSKNSHQKTKQGKKNRQNPTTTQKNFKGSERVQMYELEDLRWLLCYEPFGPV